MKGVILWSLTTVRPLTGQAAAYRLWKLPVHFEIHNAEEKTQQPRICGAQRYARREGDKLGAAQAAQRSRVGRRGRPRKERIEACQEKERSRGLGRSSAPSRKPAPDASTLGYYTLGLLLAP